MAVTRKGGARKGGRGGGRKKTGPAKGARKRGARAPSLKGAEDLPAYVKTQLHESALRPARPGARAMTANALASRARELGLSAPTRPEDLRLLVQRIDPDA